MKQIFLLVVALCATFSAQGQSSTESSFDFDRYFFNKTMRYDFVHSGDYQSEDYYFERLSQEPYYAGSQALTIDTTLGNQMFKLFDAKTGELIYASGYNTLFNEWQTTPQARSIKKGYREALVFPYPKNAARLEIYARAKDGSFTHKVTHEIDPNSYFIQQPRGAKYPVFDVHYSGNATQRVDIVLLGEGYTADQRLQFETDCKAFANALFSKEPFSSYKKSFNIRGVWSPSAEQGATSPGENMWKQTAIGSSFYTFDMERYIMIDDFQRVRDIAASAPYDLIYVLANTPKYGGGALYNTYGVSGSSTPHAADTYVHEMGHLLGALGDEYQGGVSYDDIYPTTVEPWEQNLTTLVNFPSKKIWNNLLPKKSEIPTTKEQTTGVYQGGGYVDQGVYRPAPDCLMRSRGNYCPVCHNLMVEAIKYRTR